MDILVSQLELIRSKASSDHVIEKSEKKLSMWKRHCLSTGGRIMLIKATMSNLSIYYTSVQNVEDCGGKTGLYLDLGGTYYIGEGRPEKNAFD